jgi:hypothetical protein
MLIIAYVEMAAERILLWRVRAHIRLLSTARSAVGGGVPKAFDNVALVDISRRGRFEHGRVSSEPDNLRSKPLEILPRLRGVGKHVNGVFY